MIKVPNETSKKEKVSFQIQKFLIKKSANFTQIVEICDVDKATVSKYLNELVDEGTIVLKPKRKQGIEKYTLTTKGKETTRLLLEKEKIKEQIDAMPSGKFQDFKCFIDFMIKSKEGAEFTLKLKTEGKESKIKKFKNIETTTLP
jgi:predicted transcriptional regulator